jgi:hypothetical protein
MQIDLPSNRPDTSDSGVDTGEDVDKFIDTLDDETIKRVIENVDSGSFLLIF